ncbi:TolC family protein [Sphingobacterium sp. UT-1RO-CII-1]|uniref:TolC family protein n=1 Tax=Sphingobacterium sp. UT-1RO-CII-1 TaxID=2995225 RepID=UPI00227CB9DA|nr:TolC family protein [Sphingobacterium sp. UT-1RO-CII-1]MCY4780249.1 TolC family protein [Sphingobacterium sp. UT-1RO-CII-1]
MKYINYILIIVLLLVVNILSAQQGTLVLSLDKVREKALSNNAEVKIRQYEFWEAEEQLSLEKTKRYPEVFGDFNLQRNLIIPVTPVPAKAFNQHAGENDILPLKFSTRWTGNTGLNLNYELFKPSSKSELKIKSLEVDIANTNQKVAENEAYFQASKAYVAALLAKEQVALYERELIAKKQVLGVLTERFEAGRITKITFNEGQSDYNLAKSRTAEAHNIFDKAISSLLYELGHNPHDHFDIIFEDSIESLFLSFNDLEKSEMSLSLRAIEQQGEVLQYKIKEEKAKNLPRVILGGYYGTSYFNNAFDPFKDQNFYGNSYIKTGVVVPITDWLHSKKQRSIISYQHQANQTAYMDKQRQLALSFLQAKKDVDFTYEQYVFLKDNYNLVKDNKELIEQQFKEGRLLISEVYQADFMLQQAKNEYLNAAYNYIDAQLILEYEVRK